jgi:uncharacterized integral membrane protein (TIGR00697 family)
MQQAKHSLQIDKLFISVVCMYTGSLILANLLNVSRIINFTFTILNSEFIVMAPIGLICYPITFLCTDVICELYNKKLASQLVWVGFWINLAMCGILSLAGKLPYIVGPYPDAFATISYLTISCTLSSSIAYIITQNIDIYIFHKLKKLCDGRHLWLRNNASTIISQLVDTIIVVALVKYLTGAYPNLSGDSDTNTLINVVVSMYAFKFFAALLDTVPLYIIVAKFKNRNTLSSAMA